MRIRKGQRGARQLKGFRIGVRRLTLVVIGYYSGGIEGEGWVMAVEKERERK